MKISDLNRRAFLKATGLAAAGAALDPKAESSTRTGSPKDMKAASSASTEPIDLVNVLQGTDTSRAFSRGNTLPIAALPFGMAHWTIQSRNNTSAWMFQPGDRRFQGFCCTHQLSPWLSDYGHAVFLPFCGEPGTSAESCSASWRPEKARLHPYSFRVELLRYQADVELIPTNRCAVVTARFGGDAPAGLLIECPQKQFVSCRCGKPHCPFHIHGESRWRA